MTDNIEKELLEEKDCVIKNEGGVRHLDNGQGQPLCKLTDWPYFRWNKIRGAVSCLRCLSSLYGDSKDYDSYFVTFLKLKRSGKLK